MSKACRGRLYENRTRSGRFVGTHHGDELDTDTTWSDSGSYARFATESWSRTHYGHGHHLMWRSITRRLQLLGTAD